VPDFWRSSGYHLAGIDAQGRLRPSDDFLRAFLLRPEMLPVAESCPAELALHEALLEQPALAVPAERLAALADREARAIIHDRGGRHPQSDTGITEPAPREFLTWILLARRSYVGMGQHAVGSDSAPGDDAAAQRDDRRDLPRGKIRIAEFVPRVGDFDADRA